MADKEEKKDEKAAVAEAAPAEEKKEEKKPEKAAKPKKAAGKVRPSIKKGSFYDDKGAKKLSFCPKCGPGIFMAKHKDRQTCGKCGYTEFDKKKE